jgi:predicted small secreted protein
MACWLLISTPAAVKQSLPRGGKGVSIMLRKILPLLMVLGSLAIAACNTVHGMGTDIKQGGEATEDAADAVKRKL